MIESLSYLIQQLAANRLNGTSVFGWSSPVPSFGCVSTASVATLGINPSNREFVDVNGNELEAPDRRFHTLRSLGIQRWSAATDHHLRCIRESCESYFTANPYDLWFRKLDYIIGGVASYYAVDRPKACHLDLIPYATSRKWTTLPQSERKQLLDLAGDTLGLLLASSKVQVLILNGRAVVSHFSSIIQSSLVSTAKKSWALPRRGGVDVHGYSYTTVVDRIAGVPLGRELLVLGYNHNIQSSFGVTSKVMRSIRAWVAKTIEKSSRNHVPDQRPLSYCSAIGPAP